MLLLSIPTTSAVLGDFFSSLILPSGGIPEGSLNSTLMELLTLGKLILVYSVLIEKKITGAANTLTPPCSLDFL